MREAAKESKREKIMEAAIQVFSKKGYHQTRMEEIAVAAGIGKGTIYEYFDSELQLVQHIMETSLLMYYEAMGDEERSRLSFEDRIRIMIMGHFRFCQQNKALTRILFWDTEIIDEELKDWSYQIRREKEEKMRSIVEEAMQKGEIRQADPYLVTQIFLGVMGSMLVPVILEDQEFDVAQVAQEITDLLMYGLK